MAFQFPLEALLRFRRSIERQQELKLLRALRQVLSTMQEMETVEHSILVIQKSEQDALATAIHGAQLHFDVLRRTVLWERRKQLGKLLSEQEALRAQCQKEFQVAHREREAVEILRREQFDRYRLEETRREQMRSDDLFLMRGEYLRRR